MLDKLMMIAGVSKADEEKINTVIDALLTVPATLSRIEAKLDAVIKEGEFTNEFNE